MENVTDDQIRHVNSVCETFSTAEHSNLIDGCGGNKLS